MPRFRFLFLLIVMIIPFITTIPSAGQDEFRDVAILVVDVFEDRIQPGYASSSQRPSKLELADGENNCVVPIDGQDDYTWGGGSGGVSPILGGSKPHGRLVYEHLQQLIMAANGQWTGQISGSAIQRFIGGNTEWLRDINYYSLPGFDENRIVLVSVDADGYTTEKITDRIVAAMGGLNGVGVDRFVINMSFAVVPCEDLLEINEEVYKAVLEAIIDGRDLFSETLGDGFEEFRNLFENLQNTPELLNLITGTGGHANQSRWAELLREIYYVTVMRPRFQILMGSLYNNGDDVATIVPPGASSNCTAFRISTDPLNTLQDPLFRLLVQLDNRCGLDVEPIPGVPQDIVVVPVASAGNLGFDFPFAPAIWPDVLSVSAEYEDLSDPNICPPVRDTDRGTILAAISDAGAAGRIQEAMERAEITGVDAQGEIDAYLEIPLSNSAEVRMNGIYPTFDDADNPAGCYWGTSFAAPRLSLETAIFLIHRTAPEDCDGLTTSALALAYNDWDNLPRQDASDNYCPIFNDVLTQSLDPLGVQSVNELDLSP